MTAAQTLPQGETATGDIPLIEGYFLRVTARGAGAAGNETRLRLGRDRSLLVRRYSANLRPGAGSSDVNRYFATYFFVMQHRVGLGAAIGAARTLGDLCHPQAPIGSGAYAMVEVPGEGFVLELAVLPPGTGCARNEADNDD